MLRQILLAALACVDFPAPTVCPLRRAKSADARRRSAVPYMVFLAATLIPIAARGQRWEFTQVADVAQGGRYARISGNRVVWERYDGNDWELWLYDGSIVKQLTSNNVDDVSPDISGDHVAWYRERLGDSKLFGGFDLIYDDAVIMEDISNQTDMKLEPGGLIWSARRARFDVAHVYLFDGTMTKKLSVEGTYDNHNPDMSVDSVVWSTNAGDSAYVYDGTATVELPNNVGRGQIPRISGGSIVGIAFEPGLLGVDVFLFDGIENRRLAHTASNDTHVQIAGQNVAWLSEVNGVYEVFVHDNGIAKQLSFNSVKTFAPFVSESHVVWSANRGTGYDLFVYNGLRTMQLTDDEFDNTILDISGDTFVWQRGRQGGLEIFAATFVIPEPATLAIAATGAIALTAIRRSGSKPRRRRA